MNAEKPVDAPSPLKRALVALDQMQTRLDAAESAQHEPIAIVGMGCRFPGGVNNPNQLWEFLADGGDGVVEVPPDRWDIDALYNPDPDVPGTIASRYGAFIDNVADFDPQFFGISPREAVGMDPQQRLLLEVAWESLENAAIAPDQLAGSKTGVFVALTSSDYTHVQLDARGTAGLDAYFASGTAGSTASGRLSYVLGLVGPSLTVDTACSSSLVSVHLAVQSLRNHESDLALAGGVNLILSPVNSISLSKYHMLAPDGRCKTFDAAADGFVRGEGCGLVTLKRLSDAIDDGDPIAAVIRGSAINQDGASSGLTAPNGPSQTAVIRAALADARVDASEIGYVETHGTGTSLGDPIEVQAVAQALGAERSHDDPVLLGSVKTNLGHLESVAGVAGLMKAALVVQHGEIPAHRNLDTLSPHIPWDELAVAVPTTHTPWPAESTAPDNDAELVRRAGVSAFGFSGTNAHLILESPPARGPESAANVARVLPISAASNAGLDAALQLASDALSTNTPLADLTTSYGAGRARLAERVALVGSDRDELRQKIAAVLAEPTSPSRNSAKAERRVGFLFTGQGAQWSKMAAELHRNEPVFRTSYDALIELFDAALVDELAAGLSLADIIGDASNPARLADTVFTQPAIFTIGYALAELWSSWGVEPNAMLGHSIGEIVAAVRAGVFSLEDGVKLVAARGSLMHRLTSDGAMTAIFAPATEVEELLDSTSSDLSIAALNGPAHTVISGSRPAVDALAASFADRGIKVTPLTVGQAFHSPLMTPMLDDFRAVATSIVYKPATRRIVSTVTGRSAGPEISTADYWVEHISAPVRFTEAIAAMAAMGIDTFLELGPHPVLTALGQACLPDHDATWVASLRRERDDHEQILGSVANLWISGLDIDWAALNSPHGGRRVSVPTTPFERQRYWVATSRRATPTGGHRLIGHRQQSPLQTVTFQSELSVDSLDYLNDHRVFGTPILPGTAFLEAATAAARAVNPAHTGLRDVVILEPLVADSDTIHTLVTIVEPTDGGVQVQVFSNVESSAVDDWTLHLSAMADDSAPSPSPIDIDALLTTNRRTVTGAEHYERLAELGLEFGPALQTVESINVSDVDAVGRVTARGADSSAGYHVHPALLDGCIQVLAAVASNGTDTYLPLGIERVIHHGAPNTESVRSLASLHSKPAHDTGAAAPETMRADVTMFGEDGTVLVELIGLQLKRADQASMLRLTSSSSIDDWLYEIQWVKAPAEMASNLAATTAAVDLDSVTSRVRSHADAFADSSDLLRHLPALDDLETLSTEAIRTALGQLGVKFAIGERFDAASLGVVDAHQKQFNQLMGFLADDGELEHVDNSWRVLAAPSQQETVDADRLLDTFPALSGEIGIAARCGAGLADALRGDADPLELLFPGGSTDSAETMYQTSPLAVFTNSVSASVIDAIVSGTEGKPVRILEIGGGTGGTTAHVLPRLKDRDVQYTFTDISRHFLPRARDKFNAFTFVEFETLDIETDPVEQGFADGAYDIVIATNVLHATADLGRTFAHVRKLLAPGGQLVMTEMIRPLRFIAISFGLTEGWWRFTDTALRQDSLLLDEDNWKQFFVNNGFGATYAIPAITDDAAETNNAIQAVFITNRDIDASLDSPAAESILLVGEQDQRASLIGAFSSSGSDVQWASHDDDLVEAIASAAAMGTQHVVHTSGAAERGEAETILASAVRLTRGLINSPAKTTLTFLTCGAQPVGIAPDPDKAVLAGFARTIALEHRELGVRTIDLGSTNAQDLAEAVREIVSGDREELVALRGGQRYVGKLRKAPARTIDAPVVLTFDERGTIDNLELRSTRRTAPGPGQVELRIHASALNFKDVLNVLGMYPGDPGPLGGECSGVVVGVGEGVDHLRIGQPVAALAPGAFASHVVCDARFVVPMPTSMSFAEASATLIPAVTASFSLDHVGRMSTGERVLIHAAAGGVGLAAVSLAQHVGADVFATAGTDAKRSYLRSLGVQHVYDSRSLDFADEIATDTQGEGIDIVLNSLSGEAVGASLALLRPGGRFLELGKSDIIDTDGTEASTLLAGNGVGAPIEYTAIDWTDELRLNPELMTEHVRQAMTFVADGVLDAPRVTTFPLADATDAFRYMAQARHTGKIVLTQSSASTDPDSRPIRDDRTYLITGGLRGLGLLTAAALVERGARSLALIGRSAPSEDAEAQIDVWRTDGIEVLTIAGDISSRDVVANALALIDRTAPPLAGVFHSAGVLADGALTQLSWDSYETVLAPKILGARYLNELTQDLDLDHFVLYSSIASLLGSAGQANHAASNAFLDALAHNRRGRGLAGLSINWGAWSEVGAAADRGVDIQAAAGPLGALHPGEGIAALHQVMEQNLIQVGVNRGHLGDVVADTEPRGYFADLITRRATTERAAPVHSVLQDLDAATARRRPGILLDFVRTNAARVLDLPVDRLDDDAPLSDLGLDSLMAVELRNVLGRGLGRDEPLPATLVFDYPTVSALAAHLLTTLDVSEPEAENKAATTKTSPAERTSLLDDLDQLSDDEISRRLAERRSR